MTARIPKKQCARVHRKMSTLAAQKSKETVRPRSNAGAARLPAQTTWERSAEKEEKRIARSLPILLRSLYAPSVRGNSAGSCDKAV